MMTTDELWNAHVTDMLDAYTREALRSLMVQQQRCGGVLTTDDIRSALRQAWNTVHSIRTMEKEI